MNKMLDIDNWYTIVDKLYHQLYKPPDYIMSDEEYFMEYAYVIRERIKGIRILSGNFQFLQPYSSQENLLLILDTLLVGAFSLLFLHFSLQEKI